MELYSYTVRSIHTLEILKTKVIIKSLLISKIGLTTSVFLLKSNHTVKENVFDNRGRKRYYFCLVTGTIDMLILFNK